MPLAASFGSRRLPAGLAASLFLDFYIRRIPWRNFWGWNKGPLFALLFVLTLAADGVIPGDGGCNSDTLSCATRGRNWISPVGIVQVGS